MGNIDAYFSAHEAAYERRYGPIFMGTLIEDMRADRSSYKQDLRKRHKTGKHETAICEICGGEFPRLADAQLKRRKCPDCHDNAHAGRSK